MKTDAAVWNRAASTPPEVGAVDVNPFNYLSAGMQGAFGGLLGKAASDIESIEQEVQKQAKRAKGAVEKAAVPPEPAKVPPEPEQRPSNVFRRLRGMSVPWYRQSWVKLAAIGAAGLALGGLFLKR
jgi:hypothetical protein